MDIKKFLCSGVRAVCFWNVLVNLFTKSLEDFFCSSGYTVLFQLKGGGQRKVSIRFWISAFHLSSVWTQGYFEKNPFKYLVSFQLGKPVTISASIEELNSVSLEIKKHPLPRWKIKKPCISHAWSQEPTLTTHAQKGFLEVKKGVILTDAHYP